MLGRMKPEPRLSWSTMDGDGAKAGKPKPVPVPRRPTPNPNAALQNNNNGDLEGPRLRTPVPKPVPLPRKLLQRLSPVPSNTDKRKSVKSPLLQAQKGTSSLPLCPSPLTDDEKRGTINIFQRGRNIDPFEEFEKSLQDEQLLSSVSFQSPLEELTPKDLARLSGSTTRSSLSDELSRRFDEPVGTPPPLPISPVPSKEDSVHLDIVSETAINGNAEDEVEDPNEQLMYEPISSYASSESSSISCEYSVVTKPKKRVTLPEAYHDKGSKSSTSSVPSFEALGFTSLGDRSSSGDCNSQYTKITSEEPVLSSASRTSSLTAIDGRDKTFVRSVSSRSSTGSEVKPKSRGRHEYDDVAIEDGTVVFLDNQLNSHSENNNSNSSITRSQNSIVMEFDPLFETDPAKRIQNPRETYIKSAHTSTSTESRSSQDPDHRYEYIDTDGTGEDYEMNGNCVEEIVEPIQNPRVTRVISFPNTMTTLNPNYLHDADTPVASSNENEHSEPDRPVSAKEPEEAYEPVLPPTPQRENSQSPPKEDGPSNPTIGSIKRSEQGSFLRRLSHKMRLIPIREEAKVNTETSSTGPSPCETCLEVHAEGTRCRFVPQSRPHIVYSSYLYRPTGLVQKEFTKRWAVLAKGNLTFHNEKSVALEEISLARAAAITKRNDQRVSPSGQELKCFEFSFVNGKNSSLILAGTTEGERCTWMQKYMEAFAPSFPTHVISAYDRGGWCFIKESVTANWNPSWMILKGRTLLYTFTSQEEYFELDLRKARSISVTTKDGEQSCSYVENSEVLTVDMICRILYVQTESPKITSAWEKVIGAAARQNGTEFSEMQLTMDNVPVIVDKCIDFLYAHGTLAEGIYRQSGSNTRITQLLSDFQKDSWGVQISHKDFSAHDVAGTLKRFFRTLPEPLFTTKLYSKWIAVSTLTNQDAKITEYIDLLEQLPPINHNILKKLICHLYAVHELHEKNFMPLNNLAPIWGPTLMNVEPTSKLTPAAQSDQQYKSACAESEVVKDLIENYYVLFRVDSISREKEKKMQDALEHFHLGNTKRKCSGDMKMWIYIWEKDETTAINITLTPLSTAHTIVQQLCRMAQLRNYDNLSLHEVICQKSLERPLHPSEVVIESVLRWSIWDIDERKDNYLILKKNTLYPALIPHAKDPTAVYGELKYAESKSKSFRKYAFTFRAAMLKYYKDSKSSTELSSWKIEDIVWYMGSEPKRTPPTRWTFTFVKRNYTFKRSREEPFFGNVVCCNSEEELHRWIGALVVGEHPAGLYPSVIV